MAINNSQKSVIHWFQSNTVAFIPKLVEVLGSIKAGLFLSQLLFWWGRGKHQYFVCKTHDELKNETGLSRREQDNAILRCKKMGFIEVVLKGDPRRRHFKLNMNKIREAGEELCAKNR